MLQSTFFTNILMANQKSINNSSLQKINEMYSIWSTDKPIFRDFEFFSIHPIIQYARLMMYTILKSNASEETYLHGYQESVSMKFPSLIDAERE